jgi:hypothetical protein
MISLGDGAQKVPTGGLPNTCAVLMVSAVTAVTVWHSVPPASSDRQQQHAVRHCQVVGCNGTPWGTSSLTHS